VTSYPRILIHDLVAAHVSLGVDVETSAGVADDLKHLNQVRTRVGLAWAIG
jgi:hypothetical protein